MSPTIHFDHTNGKTTVTYPCRCGETHTGLYAAEDYAHHNCFHDATLLFVESDDPNESDVFCPQCGESWLVRNAC